MPFGIITLLVSATLGAVAWRVPAAYPWLLWPALACLVVTAGYFGLGATVVGKRPDGTIPWWRGTILFPYLVYTWTFWWLYCTFSRERIFDVVAPGLWLGRRVRPAELPAGMTVVVDMTAEFPASTTIVASGVYRSLPALDGSVPNQAAFLALVTELAAHKGSIYVHCAFGHSRSATLVAGILLARGLAADVDDAERRMKAVRPRVHLVAAQHRLAALVQAGGRFSPIPAR